MKDNLFNIMQDKDWSLFRNFVKKKLVESFIINKHFNEYWFKKKKMVNFY